MLAGGAGRRMGTDKAFLQLDGLTLVERVAAALYEAGCASVKVVGGDAARVAELGMAHVEDAWPCQGPLGGIITALRNASAETVAVLACDLTRPCALAVSALRDKLGGADVSVPVSDGQAEWLHAVWRRSALDALERSFADGVRAPKHAVGALDVSWFNQGDPAWFHDADYPTDLPGQSNGPGCQSDSPPRSR